MEKIVTKIDSEIKIFFPKVDRKTNIEQIMYCLTSFDKLNWNELIEKSREYLAKEYEFGGRCQIDLETGQVKVAIEVTQQKSHQVNMQSIREYGPITWHTHPNKSNKLGCPYPSYPDLMNSLKRARAKDVLWNIIISKDSSGNSCLLLYRPNDNVLTSTQEKSNDVICYRYFCEILADIDYYQASSGCYKTALDRYFEIKFIGIPRKDNKFRSLKKQLHYFKDKRYPEPYGMFKKIVREMPRRIKVRKFIKIQLSILFVTATLSIIRKIVAT